ncbi:ABC transporter permease [Acutalibacter caecimuris]|uniref:ABC transporter permease n=1 Tax=Acutalibacter caecimuris TaxID=3093657 RepID=UPI002AC9CA7D|nr:ABC transporter permease subunit [Acutalibacter sp. M00118]
MKEKAMNNKSGRLWKGIAKNWQLYLMFVPVLAYFIIFCYVPMYGVQIAFKDFAGSLGIWGSPWVGFKHFIRFFNGSNCGMIIWNTITISLYSLAVGFPVPILLALMLNEVRNKHFKKTVQTVTYAPYFISMVVMAGMIMLFLSPSSGIINTARKAMGLEVVNFMYESKYFKTIYVLTGVWQNAGWGSIIYLSALAGIDPALHEAAVIDGASRMQRIWHINIPGILPTVCIMLIMNCGSLMSVGFEKVFLLMNDLNRSSAEVISTYVYKVGLTQSQYSFSTAINLFNSVINFITLLTVNTIVKKLDQTSLF